MPNNYIIQDRLVVPFKNFTAGQIIESKQFNDDMLDIEDKINEIINIYNLNRANVDEHINNYNNPHFITPDKIGTYNYGEIDEIIEDIKSGNLYDNSINNKVLNDNCVENRNIKDKSITSVKVDNDFGSQIDISKNIDVLNKYSKDEIDEIISNKVGNGTYSKEQIDDKFADVQAGQIVDYTIGIDKLKEDVGENLDISNNPSIIERYSNFDIDVLIKENGMPKDWGSITEDSNITVYGVLPVADYMLANSFISPATPVLDIGIKEVVDTRNTYENLCHRIDTLENALVSVLDMFSEVVNNG